MRDMATEVSRSLRHPSSPPSRWTRAQGLAASRLADEETRAARAAADALGRDTTTQEREDALLAALLAEEETAAAAAASGATAAEGDAALAASLQREEDMKAAAAAAAAAVSPTGHASPLTPSIGRNLMGDAIERGGTEAWHGQPEPAWYPSHRFNDPRARGGSAGYGWGGGTNADDEDASLALARAIQAEEESGLSQSGGPGGGANADDEDASLALARAIQAEEEAAAGRLASPSANTPLASPSANTPRPPPGLCPGCKQSTKFALGGTLRALGAVWHRACFTCGTCNGPIAESRFAVKDGRPYHQSCYREKFHPRCTVCACKIAEDPSNGSVRFMTHPYWGTPYCPGHDVDGTRRCDGCDRLEARGGRGAAGVGGNTGEGGGGGEFAELEDGRVLCLECASTAVMNEELDAPRLYDDVCEFLARQGMPLLPQRPPLHLVAQVALNDADNKEGWHRGRTARTRGLCLFEEHTMHTVERTPEWGGFGGLIPVGFSERVVGSRAGPTVVKAVVILYGLPAVAAGAVLAHECTHAYIRLAGGYPRLEPKVEEGLCQLIALLWVENAALHGVARFKNPEGRKGAVGGPSGRSDGWEETNLAAMAGYVGNQIRTDPSEVYGDGLRAALKAYQRHGLEAVFRHVRATGQLPV